MTAYFENSRKTIAHQVYTDMRSNLAGFKRFVEEMDQSVEKKMDGSDDAPKHDTKMDYFGGLGDEMGMTWKDIVKAYTNADSDDEAIYHQGKKVNDKPGGAPPNAGAAFSAGSKGHEINYKTKGWVIVPGTLTANGADIMFIPGKNDRSYLDGGKMLNKGKPDTTRRHLNRQELLKFLMGDWTKATQGAGGGAPPGGDPMAAMGGGAPPGGAPGGAPPGGAPPAPGGM